MIKPIRKSEIFTLRHAGGGVHVRLDREDGGHYTVIFDSHLVPIWVRTIYRDGRARMLWNRDRTSAFATGVARQAIHIALDVIRKGGDHGRAA